MKKLLLPFLLIASFVSQAQTSSAEEKILMDLEKQRSEAIVSRNAGVLNNLYHDQFWGVTAKGVVVDKKALLEILKSNSPDVVFSMEELKASIYGYAGVTSGKVIGKGKDGAVVSQSRFMHVYVKRNGQWKIIEGQATALAE